MWTVPVLFWVLGSVWFWDSAQGGTIGVNEDDIVTPGTGDGMVPPGIEDKITTTGATGGLNESTGKAPLVDNAGDETQTTDKKDGLPVVTLVGIIVGVLLAIGFVGGIFIVVMKKISGRFSP
ncbi:podoplanin, isoform CRA_b [Mus musculus]|nr:podoplanin, isoform CRA_b [Mus musculus]